MYVQFWYNHCDRQPFVTSNQLTACHETCGQHHTTGTTPNIIQAVCRKVFLENTAVTQAIKLFRLRGTGIYKYRVHKMPPQSLSVCTFWHTRVTTGLISDTRSREMEESRRPLDRRESSIDSYPNFKRHPVSLPTGARRFIAMFRSSSIRNAK